MINKKIIDIRETVIKMKTKKVNTIWLMLLVVQAMLLAVFITGLAVAATPDIPAGVTQYKLNGVTVISQGGTTDEATVRIFATISDPDLDNVQLQVEIVESVNAFANAPNCYSPYVLSGDDATAPCTGLSVGKSYKWQARVSDGAGTSAWVLFGVTDPDVTVSYNRLIHNSTTVGNSAQDGVWGVAGGKYGEFVCSTCHTQTGSTTNIKMIRQAIASPNASDTWPNGSTTTGPISFTVADGVNTDMGDASATGGWTGVCNVCHNNNPLDHTHYTYNSSDGHNAGMDCSECHFHSKAFAVGCTDCHGQPPVDIATMVSIPGTTSSTTPGAHNFHVNTKSYNCDTCHYNTMSAAQHNNGGSRDISIGFYIASGTIQGGNYDGQSGVGYDALTTSAATTVSAAGTKACTVYCHSSVQSADGTSSVPASYSAPVWDGSVACGSCHKTNAPHPMIDTGSHVAHLTISGVNGCGDCHTGAADNASSYTSATHVNFLIDVANSYSAGGARGNGYGTCATAVCHNDGTVNSLPSPTWGNSVAQCSQCHGAVPVTGSHTAHLTATVNGSSIVCGNCHKDAVQSVSPPSAPDHLDGNVDVKDAVDGDLGYPANVAKHTSGSGYSTCTNASCHVSAYGTGSVTTEIWGTSSTCGTCHTIDVNGAPATGSHNKHLASSAVCGNCHNAAVKDTNGGVEHIDGNIDIYDVSSGDLGYPGNVAKHAAGSGYSTCSTVYCHSNVQAPGGSAGATIYATPAWGGSALDCASCHTNMATTTDLTLGTHMRHTNTPGVAQFSCSMCHGTGYSSSTVAYPPHVNGNINLSFTGQASGTTYSQAGLNPPGNGYGTCSTSNCHGRGTKNWGASSESPTCEKCHGSSDTASATGGFKDTAGSTGSVYAGTHVSHVVGIHNYANPLNCNQCHITPTAPSDPGHNDTAAPAELTFASMATHNRLVGTVYTSAMVPTYSGSPTRQCSNTYCHAGVRATNGSGDDLGPDGAGPSPVWGDPAYLGGSGCGKCHGNPPAYPHENYSTNCAACHTHVAGNNISFVDKSKHVNGILEVDPDACLECHSFDSSRPLIGAHVLHTDPDYMLSTFVASGTATGGSTNTLIDTSATFTSATVGQYLRMNSGLNVYKQAKVTAYTTTTLTISPALSSSIANGDTYDIRKAKLLSAGDYGDPSWIYSISYKNGFPKYACGTCHPMDDPTIRNNGIVELDLNPAHAAAGTVKTKNSPIGPYAPMSSTGEWVNPARITGSSVICNGIYCHSNGYVASATTAYTFKETPNWYSVIITASGTVTSEPWSSVDRCAQCHGNSPNTGGTAGSTAHAKHVVGVHYKDLFSGATGEMSQTGASGSAHGDPLSSTTINCNICHNSTVAVSYNDKNTLCSTCHTASPQGTMYVKTDNQSHINGSVNVSFASATTIKSRAQVRNFITTVNELNNSWTRTNGYKASNSYDGTKGTPTYSAGTCLTTACHNGTTMEWEQPGPLSCNACHKGLAQ